MILIKLKVLKQLFSNMTPFCLKYKEKEPSLVDCCNKRLISNLWAVVGFFSPYSPPDQKLVNMWNIFVSFQFDCFEAVHWQDLWIHQVFLQYFASFIILNPCRYFFPWGLTINSLPLLQIPKKVYAYSFLFFSAHLSAFRYVTHTFLLKGIFHDDI